jgi:hypothetical protein
LRGGMVTSRWRRAPLFVGGPNGCDEIQIGEGPFEFDPTHLPGYCEAIPRLFYCHRSGIERIEFIAENAQEFDRAEPLHAPFEPAIHHGGLPQSPEVFLAESALTASAIAVGPRNIQGDLGIHETDFKAVYLLDEAPERTECVGILTLGGSTASQGLRGIVFQRTAVSRAWCRRQWI